MAAKRRSQKRQMSLVGFMQAGNVTVYAGSWRHPATDHGFLDQRFYQQLGRTLEQGCFDLMFFDDRLAMPGIYGGSVARGARLSGPPAHLGPDTVLSTPAGATQPTGLRGTCSTTVSTPFPHAGSFST